MNFAPASVKQLSEKAKLRQVRNLMHHPRSMHLQPDLRQSLDLRMTRFVKDSLVNG